MGNLAATPLPVNAHSLDAGLAARPFAAGWLALKDAGGDPVVVRPGTNRALWFNPKRSLGRAALEREAERHGDHNIGVDCGQSDITVIDLDTPDLHTLRFMLDELGHTPLIVRTPRGGFHLYFRSAGEACGSFGDHPDENWRRIKGDVKGRGGLVVAPPSVRPDGAYTFHTAGGWVPFSELPTIPAGHPAVAPFRSETRKAPSAPVERLRPQVGSAEPVRAGNRNNVLFRHVLELLAPYNGCPRGQVEVRGLALAHEAIASGMIDASDGHPFTEGDVRRAIVKAIDYTAAGENYYAFARGTAGRVEDDIGACTFDGVFESDAFAFLTFLRSRHGPAEFVLGTVGMESADVLPGWPRARYIRAIKRLTAADRLVVVHRGGKGKGDPSRYRLA